MSEPDAEMLAAFAKVLVAEGTLREAEVALRDSTTLLSLKVAEAGTSLVDAWKDVESLMEQTGEYEVILPGSTTDYKIGRSKPRGSVKVVSPDAVPDEFVKMERKPKLKEIAEHLKALTERGEPQPNWASFEKGEGKLGWSAIKKGKA